MDGFKAPSHRSPRSPRSPRIKNMFAQTQRLPTDTCTDAEDLTPREPNRPFRQLPCRTYISVGACPYRERCVFIHDPRIASTYTVKLKSKVPFVKEVSLECAKNEQKVVEDSNQDGFYWPTMDPHAPIPLVKDVDNGLVLDQYL